MPIEIRDGSGELQYITTASGDGSVGSPFVITVSSGAGSVSIVPGSTGPVAMDDFIKGQSNNATDTSFPARVPTITTPVASSSRAVITWVGRSSLLLIPFGKSTSNQTFKLRILGWQQITAAAVTLWVPTLICEATVTLSILTGVATATVDNTNLFSDTIAVTQGIGIAVGAADDLAPAYLSVGIDSYDLVEVIFNRNSSATECNVLYNTY